jgi:hypothetical protein
LTHFPCFVISAFFDEHHEATSGHINPPVVRRINRVWASHTAADPKVKHVDMVYDPVKWRQRLRDDLLKRGPGHSRRLDPRSPTLFDVEYLDLRLPDHRSFMISIFEIFQEETGYSNRAGLYRFIPERGPYWTQKTYDELWPHNRALADEILPWVDFCAPWCHPVDRAEWNESRWRDNYSSHIDRVLQMCRFYARPAYLDLTLNYHPSSKARANTLLSPGRIRFLIGRMRQLGAAGVLIDASTTESKVAADTPQWKALLEALA